MFKPLSVEINKFYAPLLDAKDAATSSSTLIVSHISLLFAISAPAVFYSMQVMVDPEREMSSSVAFLPFVGVATIGVGDSFASVVGSAYGRTKWRDVLPKGMEEEEEGEEKPDDKSAAGGRSVEGTIACIFSMLFAASVVYVLAIQPNENVVGAKGLVVFVRRTFLKFAVLGMVEASTEAIDNVVLPVVGIILFSF